MVLYFFYLRFASSTKFGLDVDGRMIQPMVQRVFHRMVHIAYCTVHTVHIPHPSWHHAVSSEKVPQKPAARPSYQKQNTRVYTLPKTAASHWRKNSRIREGT